MWNTRSSYPINAMRKIKFLLMLILIPIIVVGIITVRNNSKITNTVRAVGDLTVTYWGVPLGAPVFNVTNMAPGDPAETQIIDVNNGGTVPRFVAVKAIKTSPDDPTNPLEGVLHLTLDEDGTNKFNGTLENFFTQSETTNGFQLSVVNPNQTKHYTFTVDFPSAAGNDYQTKSVVFDITFGIITGENVVINEVYYKVDSTYGLDSPKESRDANGKKKGINDEWIELYNPTDHDISLKNWTFTDNSGAAVKINANKIIKAGGFALVSKDADPWRFWNENTDAVKIELGSQIGDGLDNLGDRIILRNSSGTEVDKVSWGTDKAAFDPSVPDVSLGSSIERLAPGFDTDSSTDWTDRFPPTPGN
jgi:hypothetical protein